MEKDKVEPPSILRASGSYKGAEAPAQSQAQAQVPSQQSITIELPAPPVVAAGEGSVDEGDTVAQEERRERRQHFEELRRDHYRNMYHNCPNGNEEQCQSGSGQCPAPKTPPTPPPE